MNEWLQSLRQLYQDFFQMNGWIGKGDNPSIELLRGCCENEYCFYEKIVEGNDPTRARLGQAMMIHAGVGLLAFGRFAALERMLITIRDNPEVMTSREAGAVVKAMRKLIPFPQTCDPITSPELALNWFWQHSTQLDWDEQKGAFTLDRASMPSETERKN
jgi:hypothetical protein